MILVTDLAVAVPAVAMDAPPAGDMVAVVRAGERGPLRDAEGGFESVEPGGVCRRPRGVDVQAAERRQEARMITDIAQVIHDDKETLARVARPPGAETLR